MTSPYEDDQPEHALRNAAGEIIYADGDGRVAPDSPPLGPVPPGPVPIKPTVLPGGALNKDAVNRALRTLYQNVGIDVLVAVVALLLPIVTSARGFDDFQWSLIVFSICKTALLTVFAYVMRRYLDRSPLPTPEPPVYPGEPSDKEVPVNPV